MWLELETRGGHWRHGVGTGDVGWAQETWDGGIYTGDMGCESLIWGGNL